MEKRWGPTKCANPVKCAKTRKSLRKCAKTFVSFTLRDLRILQDTKMRKDTRKCAKTLEKAQRRLKCAKTPKYGAKTPDKAIYGAKTPKKWRKDAKIWRKDARYG